MTQQAAQPEIVRSHSHIGPDRSVISAAIQRWNSPSLPLLITAVMYCGLILVTVRDQGYDFSYFVAAGHRFCEVNQVPKSLTVPLSAGSYDGYDGQFYYRLALNPFTSKVTDFGIQLDHPAYRHQRILYPLIVWMMSFGCIHCVPVLMVVVNVLCLCLLGWLGGIFARSAGLHSLWGLAFPFYPGFLLSLERDLTDILCATLLLGSLLCVRHRRHLAAALLLSLAVLTRETVLLVAVGATYVWLKGVQDKKAADRLPWYFPMFALFTYSIWQFILLRNWGFRLWNEAHAGAAGSSLGWPFAGFLSRLASNAASKTQVQRVDFVDMLLIGVFAAAVAWSMRTSAASRLEKSACLLYAGLAVFFTGDMWVEDWAFLRVLSEFCVVGTMILLLSPSKMRMPIFVSWGAVWVSYFLRFTDMSDRALHRLTHF